MRNVAWGVQPLRFAEPSDGSVRGGFGCMLVIGRLDIETTDGSFYISIEPPGFALNAPSSTASSFWSGYLAEKVDDLYFSETKEHLPNSLLRSLSGYELIHVKDEWLSGRNR